MTRGRAGNTCYVDVPDPDDDDTPDEWGMVRKVVPIDAAAVLKGVLGNQAHEQTAHEVRDTEHGYASDFARMVFEYDYVTASTRTQDVLAWLESTVSPERKEAILEDRLFTALIHAGPHLHLPEGMNPETSTVEEMIAAIPTLDPGPVIPDVGNITTGAATANHEAARIKTTLKAQLNARLDQLTPPLAGAEAPAWVHTLREEHPHATDFRPLVQAVTAWREVSGQQDAATAWGEPPKSTDKTMSDYYANARAFIPSPIRETREVPDARDDATFDVDAARVMHAEALLKQLLPAGNVTAPTGPWSEDSPAVGADFDHVWEL